MGNVGSHIVGSYTEITNDTKDLALICVGPDWKILRITLAVVGNLLVFLPGIGDVIAGLGDTAIEAVDEGMMALDLSDFTDDEALEEEMAHMNEEQKGRFKEFLNKTEISVDQGDDGVIEIKARLPWEKIIMGGVKMTARLVPVLIMEGVAQTLIKKFKEKHHYTTVKPGHAFMSHKKTLSDPLRCHAVRFTHDGYTLHCWTASPEVRTASWNKKVKKYELTGGKFHWKKSLTCKLTITNPEPPTVKPTEALPRMESAEAKPDVTLPQAEPDSMVTRACDAEIAIREEAIACTPSVVQQVSHKMCWPTLLCSAAFADTPIKERSSKAEANLA